MKNPTLRCELYLPGILPAEAFDRFVSDLGVALRAVEMRWTPGPAGWLFESRPGESDRAFARVAAWEPGRRISLAWSPVPPEHPSRPVEVVCGFETTESGTRLTVEYGPWPESTPLQDADGRMAWFASRILAPIFQATAPRGFGDWWTDRRARRPSGAEARKTYADPTFHRPNFLLILERLHLRRTDRLLEVGCGGGAFLRMALASGCRGWAVDHSAEMVALARELNARAVADHRLEIHEADATHLPFPDGTCNCAVTTGSIGFWEEPVRGLAEILRVLEPGGRLLLFTGAKELRGTPAAPEPIASRVHWYEDDELAHLARAAGFERVRVDRPEMGRFARQAGLPAEAVAFFEEGPPSGQLLEARRPGRPTGPASKPSHRRPRRA